MRMICWNVNGLRAVHKKGFREWLFKESADIVCVQETKASQDQVPPDLKELPGYHSYFVTAEDKGGYSGVAMFSKSRPKKVEPGLGVSRFDREGRVIVAHFPHFVLFNIYFPNGKASSERLRFKMEFYEEFLRVVTELMQAGKEVVLCGDINTAHQEIDLARPKENSKISGFLPEEREWMDRLTRAGMVDTFRALHPEPGRYSWWDMKSRARERNVGWRIDYFFISSGLLPRLRSAFIMDEVMGSDHCPVGIELD